jgi:phosphatidylinositol 3-kinase
LFSLQVRSYAIETLSSSSDEELHLYLLQLVQALKYEEDVSGGTSGGEDVSKVFSHLDGGRKSSKVLSLANFLIERASRHISLSNFLFW